jgi:transposase
MNISMIALDTAKAVMQVHGVNKEGRAEIKRKLRRGEVVEFFAAQPACIVVLEACGAAHHWGRVLGALGHAVKLIAPEAVRPFVKKGKKNDAADAAALCEAARRPEVKFVPVKSVEQQATLALHTARALLVKQQTMLSNALRGLAAEFGLTVPQGFVKLEQLMGIAEAQDQAILPETAQRALRTLYGRFRALEEEVTMLEKAVVAHARQDPTTFWTMLRISRLGWC